MVLLGPPPAHSRGCRGAHDRAARRWQVIQESSLSTLAHRRYEPRSHDSKASSPARAAPVRSPVRPCHSAATPSRIWLRTSASKKPLTCCGRVSCRMLRSSRCCAEGSTRASPCRRDADVADGSAEGGQPMDFLSAVVAGLALHDPDANHLDLPRQTRAAASFRPRTRGLRFACASARPPKPRGIAGFGRAAATCGRKVSATRVAGILDVARHELLDLALALVIARDHV